MIVLMAAILAGVLIALFDEDEDDWETQARREWEQRLRERRP